MAERAYVIGRQDDKTTDKVIEMLRKEGVEVKELRHPEYEETELFTSKGVFKGEAGAKMFLSLLR